MSPLSNAVKNKTSKTNSQVTACPFGDRQKTISVPRNVRAALGDVKGGKTAASVEKISFRVQKASTSSLCALLGDRIDDACKNQMAVTKSENWSSYARACWMHLKSSGGNMIEVNT